MTSKTLQLETTGWLRPVDFIREGGIVSLHFKHTKTGAPAMATLPEEDVYEDWPLEIYREFNRDYPDAQDYTGEVMKYCRRCRHGAA